MNYIYLSHNFHKFFFHFLRFNVPLNFTNFDINFRDGNLSVFFNDLYFCSFINNHFFIGDSDNLQNWNLQNHRFLNDSWNSYNLLHDSWNCNNFLNNFFNNFNSRHFNNLLNDSFLDALKHLNNFLFNVDRDRNFLLDNFPFLIPDNHRFFNMNFHRLIFMADFGNLLFNYDQFFFIGMNWNNLFNMAFDFLEDLFDNGLIYVNGIRDIFNFEIPFDKVTLLDDDFFGNLSIDINFHLVWHSIWLAVLRLFDHHHLLDQLFNNLGYLCLFNNNFRNLDFHWVFFSQHIWNMLLNNSIIRFFVNNWNLFWV